MFGPEKKTRIAGGSWRTRVFPKFGNTFLLAQLFLGSAARREAPKLLGSSSRSRFRVEAEATAPHCRARTHLRQRLKKQPISKLWRSPLHFAAARRRALRKNSGRHSAAATRAGNTSRTLTVSRHSYTVALPLRAIFRSLTAKGVPPPSHSAVVNCSWHIGDNHKVIRKTRAHILGGAGHRRISLSPELWTRALDELISLYLPLELLITFSFF